MRAWVVYKGDRFAALRSDDTNDEREAYSFFLDEATLFTTKEEAEEDCRICGDDGVVEVEIPLVENKNESDSCK